MIIQYEILFDVAVKNDYYSENDSSDFDITPTPECAEILNSYNLIFRKNEYGFKIFAQVIPGTSPPRLFTSIGDSSLKFTFEISSHNPYIDGISKLPAFNPAVETLYFSNLREDIDVGLNYLGDQISNLRVGNPVQLVTTSNLNYKFGSPANSAVFTLKDIFDNLYSLPNPEFSFSDPGDTVNSFQHNLSEVPEIRSGRYLMSDNLAGNLPLYYSRSSYAKRVFGIIEIYTNTNDLVSPSANLVPLSYRFIDNDEITGKGHYHIGFAASEYKWMYVCRKNPENSGNGFDVNKLTVDGPVNFSKVGGDDIVERKILSQDPITSSENRKDINLLHDSVKILDLPSPSIGSILKKENGETFFEMYIYV